MNQHRPTKQEAEEAFRKILLHIGEDPDRPGLVETPARYIKALREMTAGYEHDVEEVLSKQFPLEGHRYDELVLSRDIPFNSLCEHHVAPFHGFAHVAYIPQPGGPILGLSKLARLVEAHALRLQVQEKLTESIAQDILEAIDPRGVAVIVKGKHTCQSHRGIRKDGWMVTSAMHGYFRDNKDGARAELLDLIKL